MAGAKGTSGQNELERSPTGGNPGVGRARVTLCVVLPKA
jgi:hypothetical protein